MNLWHTLTHLGHKPYLIPGGASEHHLGSFGYMNCAVEIAAQTAVTGARFDYLVHCSGSGSTQAGLLAGFAALGIATQVIGVSDDEETEIKKARVLTLANDALQTLDLDARVLAEQVEIIASSTNAYGKPDARIVSAIELLARTEGIVADPVYEGRAVLGLLDLANEGRFEKDANVLLMHLGGSPAIHAYAERFGQPELQRFPTWRQGCL